MNKFLELIECMKLPNAKHISTIIIKCPKKDCFKSIACIKTNPDCEGRAVSPGHLSSTHKNHTAAKISPNQFDHISDKNFSGLGKDAPFKKQGYVSYPKEKEVERADIKNGKKHEESENFINQSEIITRINKIREEINGKD
jgi:hypothetical protein